MLKKRDIIRIVRKDFGFNNKQYWVAAGAAMVMHGVRKETRDIDLGCTTEFADLLEKMSYPTMILPDKTRRIQFSDNVEIYENWLQGEIEFIDNIPVVSLEGILEMKKQLGREKDIPDIKLLEEEIAKRKKERKR